MTVTIVSATQTCGACPSQWDAVDSEGRYWYLRYRYGHGQARQYPQGPGWVDADELEPPTEVLEFYFGDTLDGSISLKEFAELAGIELALTAYREYGQYLYDEVSATIETMTSLEQWGLRPAGGSAFWRRRR